MNPLSKTRLPIGIAYALAASSGQARRCRSRSWEAWTRDTWLACSTWERDAVCLSGYCSALAHGKGFQRSMDLPGEPHGHTHRHEGLARSQAHHPGTHRRHEH